MAAFFDAANTAWERVQIDPHIRYIGPRYIAQIIKECFLRGNLSTKSSQTLLWKHKVTLKTHYTRKRKEGNVRSSGFPSSDFFSLFCMNSPSCIIQEEFNLGACQWVGIKKIPFRTRIFLLLLFNESNKIRNQKVRPLKKKVIFLISYFLTSILQASNIWRTLLEKYNSQFISAL